MNRELNLAQASHIFSAPDTLDEIERHINDVLAGESE